jgi:DNA transformation protein
LEQISNEASRIDAMALSAEFVSYLQDLFVAVPDVTIRRMFGGVGVFRHGLMFALATGEGRLAFKADETTVPEFAAEGAEEWVYEGKGKPMRMGYWHVPERLLDDTDEFKTWALKAFDAAVRADGKKPPKQRRLER